MNKIRHNVFFGLFLRMIGFGILVGIFFPFFCVTFGMEPRVAFSLLFFLSCIFAGILVGVINFLITKNSVGKKLTILKDKMAYIGHRVLVHDFSDEHSPCTEAECLIFEDSQDEFGSCADAFNTMVKSLIKTLRFQSQHRAFIERLAVNLDLEALSNFAVQSMIDFSDADAGALFIEQEGALCLVSYFGIAEPDNLVENDVLKTVMRSGKAVRMDFPENILLDGVVTAFRPTQMILQPVKFSSTVKGVVLLAAQADMAEDFLEQLDIFVYDLSLVLENSIQHDQIQKLAALDPLTGTYNRRFGLERLREEFSRSIRSGIPMGIMMMDVDRFKRVNDVYGHIAGDYVLKNIVNITQPILRKGDILIRYGGEEFLAIMPGASQVDVLRIAERIRYAVKDDKVTYCGSEISATISIGVDSYPSSDIDDPMQLIANADSALYQAKHNGRNRTELFRGTSAVERV